MSAEHNSAIAETTNPSESVTLLINSESARIRYRAMKSGCG